MTKCDDLLTIRKCQYMKEKKKQEPFNPHIRSVRKVDYQSTQDQSQIQNFKKFVHIIKKELIYITC